MKIINDFYDDVCVITVAGEFDGRGNLQLDKSLKELAHSGNYKIVMDISAIRFMGNQTISILLSNLKEFRAGGGNIKVLNPQRPVLQYLKSNRMFELFEIYASRTEAVNSFQETSPARKNASPSTTSPEQTRPLEKSPAKSDDKEESLESRFATGEILYVNSCMLATLIKTLEQKGIISSEEALQLMNTDQTPLKGE
jgi:anti-anti-sigma factor